MAVTATQLLSPSGELDPGSLWPGESSADTTARLTGYIADGVSRVSELSGLAADRAVTVWAYHRAYHSVYLRLAALPSSVTINDEGSSSTTSAQMDAFRKLSAAKRDEFDEIVAEAQGEVGTGAVQPSAAARNRYHW